MEALIDAAIVALTVLLVAVTLLPLSGSHAWWVRMWDFPRVQIAVGLALAAALALLLSGPLRWGVAGGGRRPASATSSGASCRSRRWCGRRWRFATWPRERRRDAPRRRTC